MWDTKRAYLIFRIIWAFFYCLVSLIQIRAKPTTNYTSPVYTLKYHDIRQQMPFFKSIKRPWKCIFLLVNSVLHFIDNINNQGSAIEQHSLKIRRVVLSLRMYVPFIDKKFESLTQILLVCSKVLYKVNIDKIFPLTCFSTLASTVFFQLLTVSELAKNTRLERKTLNQLRYSSAKPRNFKDVCVVGGKFYSPPPKHL